MASAVAVQTTIFRWICGAVVELQPAQSQKDGPMKNVGDPAVASTDDCRTCAETTASSRIHLPPNIATALERIELLTQREREVFQLLSEGLSNNELAVKLSITTRTAKAHVASIIDKLRLDSRLQVCLLACVYFAEVCPEDQ